MEEGSVTLTWTAPEEEFNTSVVQYLRKGDTVWKDAILAKPIITTTVTALQGSPKGYEFRVAAKDGPNTGDFSEPASHCSICDAVYAQEKATMRLKGSLEDALENPKEFYKYINGLLNNKAGAVVIHAKDRNCLEKFDQKVDSKLKDLVSDGSMYHCVFERSYFDQTHLVYRLKTSSRKRPMSTLDFKTKVSHNKGKDAPSYINITVFVGELCSSKPHPNATCAREYVFEQGNEIPRKVNGLPTDEVLQESMSIQAKSLLNCKLSQLAEHCWENGKLKEYITAFTKIKGGGSVFFAVSEEKKEEPAWISLSQDIVDVTKKGKVDKWQIWQDKKVSNPTLYYVAKKSKITEKKTGKFVTEGVQLTEQERRDFRQQISERVENELTWVGIQDHADTVKVFFHSVQKTTTGDVYVIEVRISNYHGLCFYDKDGPESYVCRFPEPGPMFTARTKLDRVPLYDWVQSFIRNFEKHMDKLNKMSDDSKVEACSFCRFVSEKC
ncbi:hypothetical protein V1264_005993 [Littorina saxatilis]|uniref:Fibronectin type-III domain-containing protein n=2 Tax=Littorina saxatilis TaxID=31220 RepID=A0AAN9G588_9CAEN